MTTHVPPAKVPPAACNGRTHSHVNAAPLLVQTPERRQQQPYRNPPPPRARAGRLVDPSMDGDLAPAGTVGLEHQAVLPPHPGHVPTSVERWFFRAGWRTGLRDGLVCGGLVGFLLAVAMVALGRAVGH